jgi:hypothetical protein
VLHYFDESARAVHDLGVSVSRRAPKLSGPDREKVSKQIPSQLASALGFNRRGRGNPFFDSDIAGTSEQFRLALRVKQVRGQLGTLGASKAIDVVAATTNRPASTVREAWNRFKRVEVVFPEDGETVDIVVPADKMIRQAAE